MLEPTWWEGGGGLVPSLKSGLVTDTPNCIKLKRSFTVFMQTLGRLTRKLKPWWWSWTWNGPLAWKSKNGGRGRSPRKILTKMSAFEAFSGDLEAGLWWPSTKVHESFIISWLTFISLREINIIYGVIGKSRTLSIWLIQLATEILIFLNLCY